MNFLKSVFGFLYDLWQVFHDPLTTPAPELPMNQDTPIAPVPPPPPINRVAEFAACIRDYEGRPPHGLNYLLNNPGDCRCSSVGYLPKYGNVVCVDTDTDPMYPYHKGKFAKFPTYELGWEYLLALIVEKTKENPTWTLLDFMQSYSPSSDANNPTMYAEYIALRMDVGIHDLMTKICGL